MNKDFDVILIDGSSYLYRAYHALPELSNSKGQHTGAIFGVVNMLKKLTKQIKTSHVAVVFDAPGKTFRDDMYSEYKANRPSMPDDLRSQIDYVHQIVRAMGLPLLCISGVEADDVIGTLAKQGAAHQKRVMISSGDKDLAQLVNETVVVKDSMKNSTYDIEGVFKKFAVRPDQIIDYLALMGDSADNIPGVPGVGPKTAAKWLSEYETVENLVKNADQIKGKIGEKLRANIDGLTLSKQLATIKCDVSLESDWDDLACQPADNEKLSELYEHLEFKSWLALLNAPSNQDDDAPQAPHKAINQFTRDSDAMDGAISYSAPAYNEIEYELITDEGALQKWMDLLKAATVFAIDTETTSLNPLTASLVGVSLAVSGRACYIPVAHDYENMPNILDKDVVLAALKPLLTSTEHTKIFHNYKYDLAIFKQINVDVVMPVADTMIMSYVLNSTASRHDMDSLAKRYLERDTIKYEEVAGKGKSQINFSQVELDKACEYAAQDAEITLALYDVFEKQLAADATLKKVYDEIDMPLVAVLELIERNGMMLDCEKLRGLSAQFQLQIHELEQNIYSEAGVEFNVASPKQIQEILYDKMQIPVIKKTPKGQPSTAEDVLQELAHSYDLPALILMHRSLSKLKSTYTDKLPEMVDDQQRVHTSLHQAVAATGRLSSSDPNLQNIPVRSEEGRKIRTAFIAPDGYQMISADYSQIELRIMAHLSQDKNLLTSFANNEDIHARTAAEIFDIDIKDVEFEQRRFSKAINFGLIYGMSAFGLAKQLEIDRSQAQRYIDVYFERYPGVKNFMDQTRIEAAEQGYVETVFGRRLYLPDINSKNHNMRQYAERTAINAPMQGTAADLIKMAMITIADELKDQADDVKMILQIHDELLIEVKEHRAQEIATRIKQLMCQVAALDVPLIVDVGMGKHWGEAH